MSLFDFLFPEHAAASHLRKLANRQEREDRLDRIRRAGESDREDRVDALEKDVGLLALVLASILETADENGTISRNEIKQKIKELDVVDGAADGRIDASFLRKWTV